MNDDFSSYEHLIQYPTAVRAPSGNHYLARDRHDAEAIQSGRTDRMGGTPCNGEGRVTKAFYPNNNPWRREMGEPAWKCR